MFEDLIDGSDAGQIGERCSHRDVHELWPRRKDGEVWPSTMGDDVPVYGNSITST